MSNGPYPRFIVLQVDSPGRKREIAEGESIDEVTKKLAEKSGLVGEYNIPSAWTWHPLHPDNPLGPEERRRRREATDPGE